MASKYLIKNMGSLDRAVRAFVIAPVAIVAAFALGASSIGGIVLFVLASVALTTGAIGICPSYVPLGIDTHGRGHARAASATRTGGLAPARTSSPERGAISRQARCAAQAFGCPTKTRVCGS